MQHLNSASDDAARRKSASGVRDVSRIIAPRCVVSPNVALKCLLVACPFDQREPADCPVCPEAWKLSLRQRMIWAGQLSEKSASDLLEEHRTCLATKERIGAISTQRRG